jgi:hypothetical protein
MRRTAARLVWLLVPVAAALSVVSVVLNWGRPLLGLDLVPIPTTIGVFLLVPVGALIAARRPRNPIGGLLLAAGLLLTLAMVASGYGFRAIGAGAALPASTVTNWVGQWLVLPMWVLVGFLNLLFPDGRLPSPRWRWFARAFVALGVLYVAAAAAEAWPRRQVVHADLEHLLPFRGDTVTAVLWPAFAALLAVTLGALVVRYRRGGEVEKAQIRWLGFAGALTLAATVLFTIDQLPGTVVIAVGTIASFGPPIAIAVAILRYRLYEIDRIISRTVSYGLVVALLGAVHVGVVVSLGAALSAVTGQEGSDLAVAASVLVVVALFRPARSRVQAAVDRRFNRSGYEAGLAVAAFAQQLRGEVDLDELRHEIVTTAATAVQPTTTSVWLADGVGTPRPREERRP